MADKLWQYRARVAQKYKGQAARFVAEESSTKAASAVAERADSLRRAFGAGEVKATKAKTVARINSIRDAAMSMRSIPHGADWAATNAQRLASPILQGRAAGFLKAAAKATVSTVAKRALGVFFPAVGAALLAKDAIDLMRSRSKVQSGGATLDAGKQKHASMGGIAHVKGHMRLNADGSASWVKDHNRRIT